MTGFIGPYNRKLKCAVLAAWVYLARLESARLERRDDAASQ
jgi:hypothetical protein